MMPPLTPLAQSHCRRRQQWLLSPPSTITIAAATQLTMMTARSQQLLFVINGGNVGHRQWKRRLMAAVAMMVFVDGGCHQQRWQWDGGTMT
jgi:hypothetical protein